jgi:hypothetical protein
MRQANSRLTLDVYAQALTPAKRAAYLKVVELIRPAVGTGSVPLCSLAEEAQSVSARFYGAAYREANRHLNLDKVREVKSNALERRHLADWKEPLIGK